MVNIIFIAFTEFMMNAENRTAQAIIGDAVAIRYESKYKFMIEASSVPDSVVITEYSAPLQEEGEAQAEGQVGENVFFYLLYY